MPVEITYIDLLFCSIFVLISAVISFVNQLGIEKKLLIGVLRATIQLMIIGFVLKFIFDYSTNPYGMGFMFFFIAINGQLIIFNTHKDKKYFFWHIFLSQTFNYLIISYIVLAIIIQNSPWYDAKYFIPILGMIAGSSINAVSLAIERFFSDVEARKALIETKLLFGSTIEDAIKDIEVNAIKAAMTPSINGLYAVGFVMIPGTMSGQIMAGSDPILASKYQLMIMLMIVASTAISSFFAIKIATYNSFDKNGIYIKDR
jgi:putative ABC transport system permease protein